jgi:hypothetical protein
MSAWSTRIWLSVLCVGLLNTWPASAQQSGTGQVSGHVVDPAGARIARASVFVRKNSPSEETVRLITHTDIAGNFVLVLPEGGYDVLVTSPGFVAGVETVPVFSGKTRKVLWKLKVLSCDFPGVNCDTFK